LTSDGKLKNCLFGLKEYDLKPYLNDAIALRKFLLQSIYEKHATRGGLTPLAKNTHTSSYGKNRSMTSIGG
jgi:cyclic pyranopterin phosphate synthase